MHKLAWKLTVAVAITGLLFLLPLGSFNWLSGRILVGIHVILGITVGVLLIKLVVSHAGPEFFNPFKDGYLKLNGVKLYIYIFLAIFSGVLLLFFSPKWLVIFHAVIGLWTIFVGWRHSKKY